MNKTSFAQQQQHNDLDKVQRYRPPIQLYRQPAVWDALLFCKIKTSLGQSVNPPIPVLLIIS